MDNTADILDKAADILEESGHCKYALSKDGAHCAFGAINMAHHSHHDRAEIFGLPETDVIETAKQLVNYLGLTVDNEYTSSWNPIGWKNVIAVVEWNNADEREGWEVVNAFRHTAKALRNV